MVIGVSCGIGDRDNLKANLRIIIIIIIGIIKPAI